MNNITLSLPIDSQFERLNLHLRPYLYIKAIAVILLLYKLSSFLRGKKNQVPFVGTFLERYSSLFAIHNARAYLIKGYEKYPNAFFLMPLYPLGNVYVANGPQLIEEIRQGSDDVFDFTEFATPSIQGDYTMGTNAKTETYHLPLIRTTLTRNLAVLFPEIVDEMKNAFDDSLGSVSTNWKSIRLQDTFMEIVSRTSNRVIVGSPICQDKGYQRLTVDFTIEVMKAATIINLFPSILHPIIGRILSPLRTYQRDMLHYLEKLIDERQQNLKLSGGDWADKPNDYLMWLIENAPPGPEQTATFLGTRILHINFAAIHTSSLTFTHALLHLAANPELAKPMRDEAESIIADEGWTKASMQKMRKADSFLRESSRLNTLGLTSIGRYLLKDHTFSNGVTIPKGSYITASAYSTHLDPKLYGGADQFDAFRFSAIREDEKESTRHQMVATAPDYLPFGYGKHACPGRFFAANELKAMLCYVVMNYDVKLEGGTARPQNEYFGMSVLPKRDACIMMRRRQTEQAI